MSYLDNDGQFPDDTKVLVKYPLPSSALSDREHWPWLRGFIVGQVDNNEWHVLVQDDRVAQYEPAVRENTYPLCWRSADELRRPPVEGASS